MAEVVSESPPQDFATFYRAHAQAVHRALAVTLGNLDLAEDAAAEGLARAFQHWSRVSRFESPAGWAYRAGLNWALSLLRRRRRESRRSIDDVVHLEEPDPTIYAALQGLDLNHRRVVVMRYVLDLSQAEIAQVLGLPLGTVKSRLSRSLEQLREVVVS